MWTYISNFLDSVQNLEIIEPLHSSLWGTSNKKRSLFHMLKTTKTIGGYVKNYIVRLVQHFTNAFFSFPFLFTVCFGGSSLLSLSEILLFKLKMVDWAFFEFQVEKCLQLESYNDIMLDFFLGLDFSEPIFCSP